jgi:hypothetical protein
MILNSGTADLIRANAVRLASCVGQKEQLADLATAGSFEQVFTAIETLLTNTDMYFDDELLVHLDESNWKSFKATLMVYALNMLNRRSNGGIAIPSFGSEASEFAMPHKN